MCVCVCVCVCVCARARVRVRVYCEEGGEMERGEGEGGVKKILRRDPQYFK